MRSASSSSSCSGTSRSQAAVAAIRPEKPRRPSWKRAVLSIASARSRARIRPLASRSRRNATAEKPAISVPSTSKKAPTAGPAGPSSISRVRSAWSAIRRRRGRYLRPGPGVEAPPASRPAPGLARIRAGGDTRDPRAPAVLAPGRRAARRLPARCLEPARAAAPRAVDRARAPRGHGFGRLRRRGDPPVAPAAARGARRSAAGGDARGGRRPAARAAARRLAALRAGRGAARAPRSAPDPRRSARPGPAPPGAGAETAPAPLLHRRGRAGAGLGAARALAARLARRLGRDEASVTRDARRYLREIAAQHSPHHIDLAANLIRFMYTQGYGETLHYDRAQLEALAALGQRHPLVFLPTHKSMLDSLVLKYALYENGLPPNHTAGGINMNFFPMGALMRRTGIFFIRRSFKDNEVYKFVLHHYIDYLVEKRFPLEWYIEGTRSRSGKLMPPRFGLPAYVVDAYRRGKSEDVLLVPVSIAYDQIQDVAGYAAEERGGRKRPESFGWFLRFVRALRRRYGEIYLRFGEPLSLARALGPPDPGAEPDPNEQSLALQKLAFEVSARINRVTPITATSLVTLALLGVANRALSVEETIASLRNPLDHVRRRDLPTSGDPDLDTPEGVRRALAALIENGVVTCFAEGPEAVYAIGPDKHLIASYYRNTIIHFFVNGAIAELALLRAAADGVADPTDEFWDEALRLRDLLKFEFFFAGKEAFREELRAEVRLHVPEWERRVAEGPAAIQALLRRFRPFSAHRVLRPFVEGYRVVADALERRPPEAVLDEGEFLRGCLALGQQHVLQRRIMNAESVSQGLFASALRLARNRSLVDPGAPDLAERRRAFAEEVRRVIRRIDAIDALVAARHAGLIE